MPMPLCQDSLEFSTARRLLGMSAQVIAEQ